MRFLRIPFVPVMLAPLALAACGSSTSPTPIVSAQPATQLGIATQPAALVSGAPLTTQPVVQLRDASGGLVVGATNAVTATLNGSGGTLSGGTTVNAANGVATFKDLTITGMGSYTLSFTSGTLTAATSASITVTNVLFQDDFKTSGAQLNVAAWTTEFGPSSFFGRTQLSDWVHAGAGGTFMVGANGAELALNTYNPGGFSLFGTHGKTVQMFVPTATRTIEFTARVQITSLQPGVVYGLYFYGCPGNCATQHDEIDIELVTNLLQPGAPPMVQLNRYANEPLGAGHGGPTSLPAGFDPLAPHDWTIRWSLSRIDYLVDGTLLGSSTNIVPQGAMSVNVNAWGPATDWPQAYSAALQPAGSAAANSRFVAYLKSVVVRAN